jgi:hypothetical protein
MAAHPEKAPQVRPVPPAPPAPAADKLDPDELSDDDLDKVSGGFQQIPAGRIPTGGNPLL